MAYSLEYEKGGISVIWKIDDFLSMQERYFDFSIDIDWIKKNDSWQIKIGIYNLIFSDSTVINIRPIQLDYQIASSLNGTVSVVDENCIFKLTRKGKEWMTKAIDFYKPGFLKDGSLTLLFNIWDSKINDQKTVEYFFHSTKIQRMKSIHLFLDGVTDWKRNGTSTECFIGSIWHTNIENKNGFSINFGLQIQGNKLYATTNKISEKNFKIYGSYKIKIQKLDETNFQFLDTKWFDFNNELNFRTFLTDRKWDNSMTEWIVTVEVTLDDYYTVIEKICYKPNVKTLGKDGVMKTQTLCKRNSFSKRNESSKNKLQHLMYNLYKDGKFCDVVICVNNESFPCHKNVLCCRSTVFQTMFENDMKEKDTGVVNIDDVEPQILDKFLNYLYLDILEEKEFDTSVKLYAMADKYAVQNLKDDCANIILSCTSTENVCEVLELADRHQDKYLMEEILTYFSEHTKEIVNSPSWKILLVNKPSLAANTFQSVFS